MRCVAHADSGAGAIQLAVVLTHDEQVIIGRIPHHAGAFLAACLQEMPALRLGLLLVDKANLVTFFKPCAALAATVQKRPDDPAIFLVFLGPVRLSAAVEIDRGAGGEGLEFAGAENPFGGRCGFPPFLREGGGGHYGG